jgi:hypothetical protein
MQLNPTLASHYTAHVRPAAPLNPSKKRVLRKRTPELHDSKEPTDKLAPQNTRKNTYNTVKNTTKSQLFGPTNPSRWKQKIRICLIRVSHPPPRPCSTEIGRAPTKMQIEANYPRPSAKMHCRAHKLLILNKTLRADKLQKPDLPPASPTISSNLFNH